MFLRHLVDRGLSGVQLIISDACRSLMESIVEARPYIWSGACNVPLQWQTCTYSASRVAYGGRSLPRAMLPVTMGHAPPLARVHRAGPTCKRALPPRRFLLKPSIDNGNSLFDVQ